MTEFEKIYNKSMNGARDKISEWYEQHKDDYARFKELINKADNGDYDIYINIFKMAAEFIPQPVIWQCKKLFSKNTKDENATKHIDEGRKIALQIFEDAYTEICTMKGYFRIGIESNEEMERQESLSEDESAFFPFEEENEKDRTILSSLGIYNVQEKDDSDKHHYYMPIKTGEELWNTLPVAIRFGLPLFLGKSAKELGGIFIHITMAFVMTLSGMYENMLERMDKDGDNNLLHCVLYYVSLDGGLVHSAKCLAKMLHSYKAISQILMFVPTVIGNMTKTSVKYGLDKKSDWSELKNSEDDEVSKEVTHALADTKAKRGRRMIDTETFNLDDMLIGNKEEIKAEIRAFRECNTNNTDIAFLFMVLINAECVDFKETSFPHFYHAMEKEEYRKSNMDRASRMFNFMYFQAGKFKVSRQPKYVQGRKTIYRWASIFKNCNY